MGVVEKLKSIFTVSSSGCVEESGAGQYEESTMESLKDSRTNLFNPIERIKDIGLAARKTFTKDVVKSRGLSSATVNYQYLALYRHVEPVVQLGMNPIEARLLFTKFLDEAITNDDLYSEDDLRYIRAAVNKISELQVVSDSDSFESVISAYKNSMFALEMIEYTDFCFGTDMLNQICESSYVIVDYCKDNVRKDEVSMLLMKYKDTVMPIEVGGMTFFVLSELRSVISPESSEVERRKYILDKVTPMIGRVVLKNNIDISKLVFAKNLFSTLTSEDVESPTPTPTPTNTPTSTPTPTPEPVFAPTPTPTTTEYDDGAEYSTDEAHEDEPSEAERAFAAGMSSMSKAVNTNPLDRIDGNATLSSLGIKVDAGKAVTDVGNDLTTLGLVAWCSGEDVDQDKAVCIANLTMDYLNALDENLRTAAKNQVNMLLNLYDGPLNTICDMFKMSLKEV